MTSVHWKRLEHLLTVQKETLEDFRTLEKPVGKVLTRAEEEKEFLQERVLVVNEHSVPLLQELLVPPIYSEQGGNWHRPFLVLGQR